MLARQFARRRARVAGLTLLELVVVISVLAILSTLLIPRIGALLDRSRSAAQAASTTDVAVQVEAFYGMNRKYPDGWDTLTAEGGALYAKLHPNLTSTLAGGALLTTGSLNEYQLAALGTAGISHAFLHDATSAPSDSGTDRRHFGITGSGHDGTQNINTFAVISQADGSKGLNLLVNEFGLNPNRAASDTTYTRIRKNTYVVFGLGPKATIVQSQLHEAPIIESENAATRYSRALVVFEVPNDETSLSDRARLVGVLGPDGRSKRTAAADYANINATQPH